MPIEPNPQAVSAWPHQINIPAATPGLFLSVQIQSDGTATPVVMDDTLQSLIDHLQTWPGRDPNQNVTGSKYDTLLYLVNPTNPIPLPDPPDPEETPAP